MNRTQHGIRTRGESIGALTLALLVVASVLASGVALGTDGAATTEEFSVTIAGSNSAIVEGETLRVNVTVENTGDAAGSQEIWLSVDGAAIRGDEASRTVDLGAGESRTIELRWNTGLGDGGNYTATVHSDNDTDSTDVRVLDSQNFSVGIDGTNSPVTEGNTLTVTATVENTGDSSGTKNVSLTAGGAQRDVQTVALDAGETTTVELNWETSSGDAGNYSATVASPNDTDTTDVTVEPGSPSGTASFAMDDNVAESYRGDVAEVDVSLNATDRVTLTVGSEDINYKVSMTVVDEDGDGAATVLWNTHLAGSADDESEAWSAVGPDRVTAVERTTARLDGHVAAADYPLALTVGDEETDAGLASVFAPLATNRTVHTGSRPAAWSLNTLTEDVSDFDVATENASTVARGDWLVIRIDATGTGGYVHGAADLAGAGTEGVSLSITETSLGPNEEPDTVAVEGFESPDLGFDNGTVVIVADTSSDDFELGETYEAKFVIGEENPHYDSRVERTASFRVEEPSVAVNGGDPVEVRNASAAEIVGTTNVAVGTNLTVTVWSTGENVPNGQSFESTKTVTTDENGDWSASFDFSAVPAGQEFTLTVLVGGVTEMETTGVVVDNPAPTASIPAATPTVGEALTVEPTVSDDGEITSYEWVVDGEVVSRTKVLEYTFEEPGDHEVRLSVTDDDGATATVSRTVVVNGPPTANIVVEDFVRNNTVRFDGTSSVDEDGQIVAYEWAVDVDGDGTYDRTYEGATVDTTWEDEEAHSVRLRVTDDEGATATATKPLEVGAPGTTTSPDEATPTGATAPGFGAVAALVALAGAALAVGRWR